MKEITGIVIYKTYIYKSFFPDIYTFMESILNILAIPNTISLHLRIWLMMFYVGTIKHQKPCGRKKTCFTHQSMICNVYIKLYRIYNINLKLKSDITCFIKNVKMMI